MNLTVSANLRQCTTSPEKIELFQPIRMPPEAPADGEKANLSKRLGANFLIKEWSKASFFVYCRQYTKHALSSIFALTASVLPSLLRPLMFQFSTFQLLLLVLLFIYPSCWDLTKFWPQSDRTTNSKRNQMLLQTNIKPERIMWPGTNHRWDPLPARGKVPQQQQQQQHSFFPKQVGVG